MLFRSDRKSTRLNSSHTIISYAVFCLKKKRTPDVPVRHILTLGPPGRLARSVRTTPWWRVQRFVFCNDTAPPEIYTLSLHDALPIYTSELQSHDNLVCRLLEFRR